MEILKVKRGLKEDLNLKFPLPTGWSGGIFRGALFLTGLECYYGTHEDTKSVSINDLIT